MLVVAASRHGSTAEIASRIAGVLDADLCDADAAPDPSAYDAVVVGSAVYMGRWLEPARRFADANAEALAVRPTWLFSSGPVGDPPQPAEAVDLHELAQRVHAVDHHVFAGALDRTSLGRGERLVARAVRAADGDYRDWADVERWARGIAAALATSSSS